MHRTNRSKKNRTSALPRLHVRSRNTKLLLTAFCCTAHMWYHIIIIIIIFRENLLLFLIDIKLLLLSVCVTYFIQDSSTYKSSMNVSKFSFFLLNLISILLIQQSLLNGFFVCTLHCLWLSYVLNMSKSNQSIYNWTLISSWWVYLWGLNSMILYYLSYHYYLIWDFTTSLIEAFIYIKLPTKHDYDKKKNSSN